MLKKAEKEFIEPSIGLLSSNDKSASWNLSNGHFSSKSDLTLTSTVNCISQMSTVINKQHFKVFI